MADATPTPPAETPAKKKAKRRFPPIKNFKNKGEWFDHIIKWATDEKARWLKYGDAEKKKAADKGAKFLEWIDANKNDPTMSDIIMEARKKLAPGSVGAEAPASAQQNKGKK